MSCGVASKITLGRRSGSGGEEGAHATTPERRDSRGTYQEMAAVRAVQQDRALGGHGAGAVRERANRRCIATLDS
ncbi:hypothetical protein MTP99_006521 [Tenebrio molitor]|nr:hypothetical protein MTP99_006521 [Tenebrio molitor]